MANEFDSKTLLSGDGANQYTTVTHVSFFSIITDIIFLPTPQKYYFDIYLV